MIIFRCKGVFGPSSRESQTLRDEKNNEKFPSTSKSSSKSISRKRYYDFYREPIRGFYVLRIRDTDSSLYDNGICWRISLK